jgi:hypothetical protein
MLTILEESLRLKVKDPNLVVLNLKDPLKAF